MCWGNAAPLARGPEWGPAGRPASGAPGPVELKGGRPVAAVHPGLEGPEVGWVNLASVLALLTCPICSVGRMGSSSTQDPVIYKLWDSALRRVTTSLW